MKTNLKEFRKSNGLSQVYLADFLGIGQGFISQIENGDRPLPESAISKIMSNPDWDSSMLIDSTINYQHIGDGSSNNTQVAGDAALREKINYLEERIAALEKEKASYWDLIVKLTGK